MTTAHKVTLFGIVLARLTPYQNRMKPYHELRIKYESSVNFRDNIEVTWYRMKNGALVEHHWAEYHFTDNININHFIDKVINDLQPFIN